MIRGIGGRTRRLGRASGFSGKRGFDWISEFIEVRSLGEPSGFCGNRGLNRSSEFGGRNRELGDGSGGDILRGFCGASGLFSLSRFCGDRGRGEGS